MFKNILINAKITNLQPQRNCKMLDYNIFYIGGVICKIIGIEYKKGKATHGKCVALPYRFSSE